MSKEKAYHLICDRAVCNKVYADNAFSGDSQLTRRLAHLDAICDEWMLTSPPTVAFVTGVFTSLENLTSDPERSKNVEFQLSIQRRLYTYLDQKKDSGIIKFPLVYLPIKYVDAWEPIIEHLCFGDVQLYRPIKSFNHGGTLQKWLKEEQKKYGEPFLTKYLPKK